MGLSQIFQAIQEMVATLVALQAPCFQLVKQAYGSQSKTTIQEMICISI